MPETIDLNSYGWADREAGLARIPVEDAMAIMAETLPVSDGAVESHAERAAAAVPTDAGSGRFVTGPRPGPEAR